MSTTLTAKRLKDILYNRVDLVDIGACLDPETGEGSHILLTKRAPRGAGDRKMPAKKKSEVFKALSETRRLMSALGDDEIRKSLTDEELDMLEDIVKSGAAVVAGDDVADPKDDEDEAKDDAPSDEDEDDATSDENEDEDEDDATSDEDEPKDESKRKKADTVSFTEAEFEAAIAEVLADMGIEDRDEIEADVTNEELVDLVEQELEEVGKRASGKHAFSKQLTSLSKRAAAAEARAERAERIAKAERDVRVLDSFKTFAKGFKRLPVNPDKDGALFKRMSEQLNAADYRRVTSLLKAADAAGKGFSEIGSERDDNGDADTAWAEIQKRASRIVSKDANTTIGDAIQRVIADDADLYARYVEEQRNR